MGFWKNKMLEEEQDFSNLNKFVCLDCIENDCLKNVVENNLVRIRCNYCGDGEESAPVEKLIRKILEGLEFEYSYCRFGKDGREVLNTFGTEIVDTYDILLSEIYEYIPQNLFDDIIRSINYEWHDNDPFDIDNHRSKILMWETFCNIVKHKTRYVFFKTKKEYGASYFILENVGNAVKELKLVKKLLAANDFYRARTGLFNDVKELCSPPKELAGNNRMSAAGISVFYGASDKETALAEIRCKDFVTTAIFQNIDDLIILNLTKLKHISFPDLFDEDRRKLREPLRFLCSWYKEITKQMNNEDRIEIEYIPTQIITEYFRYLFKYKGNNIDGIAYDSSVCDGICYILFIDHEQCLDEEKQKLRIKEIIQEKIK